MAITLFLCDDESGSGRQLARLLEAEAPDVEVVGVAGREDDVGPLVTETLPDLVLMPLGSEASGDRIRGIRSASPTTRVVVLTKRDKGADLYRALRAGASGCVDSEWDAAAIVTTVRAVCGGQFVIPAHVASTVLRDLSESAPSMLGDAEREVLAGIARGENAREIGTRLHGGEREVYRRVADIYSKLHLADRVHARVEAVGDSSEGRREQQHKRDRAVARAQEAVG